MSEKQLPTPLFGKFIVKNPINTSKIELTEGARKELLNQLKESLDKIQVVKADPKSETVKDGNYVKIDSNLASNYDTLGKEDEYLIFAERQISAIY